MQPLYGRGRRPFDGAQPTLIADIEDRAWTDEGELRHVSYKGFQNFLIFPQLTFVVAESCPLQR
ncbi:hypothetical protein E0H48_17150 [Rhizobium leguminosarum bv. viciae]|nr:hypothetical protein E0H48_17150 [Rhizobium leguminosarum bv. viciae]